MSRIKSNKYEICGDCNSSDPSWASINRGILLCADCCSIHRSLGRHISQVKSLRQGCWPPSVLNLVNTLNSHGANTVWEHCLMDSVASKNLRRKPTPKDALHPTKSDFIRAKHVNLSFILKPSVQDDQNTNLESELSKQLHASCRAPNLETSLRLLVQGADPNYFHEDKGSTPLHVAVKSGQASQVELLIVYGADLTATDSQGKTPRDLAKDRAIENRLIEAMYEVTDRVCYFLCGRKPDHQKGEHFIIPDHNKIEISEQLKIARNKLQLIPNKMFEELVMDLYDEVDRRETEAVWSTSSLNPDSGAVPFLPTNPHLSATRNQGRQKLARFSETEFAGLLVDVLTDARRRQNLATLRPLDSLYNPHGPQLKEFNHPWRGSNLSDDGEPLYDAVASDDDYAALAPVAQQAVVNQSPMTTVQTAEVEVLKKQLIQSEMTISELKTMVARLSTENSELKSKKIEPIYKLPTDTQTNDNEETETEPVLDGKPSSYKRPVSMYEAREYTKFQHPENRSTTSMYTMAPRNHGPTTLPLVEEVTRRTDYVTRRIQELWAVMQDPTKKNVYVPHGEHIRVAVAELSAIFPQQIKDETIRDALKQLNSSTARVQVECTGLQKALLTDDVESADAFMQELRNCAYFLARATKTIVTQFSQ